MKRARTRLTRTGTVAVAATVVLAGAASAVYQVTGRRSAHANLPAGPRPAPATLRAAVSPASVTYGATVTVTGTVHDAAGQALAGRTVEVLTARTGATTAPSVVATPTTGADGRVSVPLRPDFGTSVWLRYAGDAAARAAESEPVRVAVAQRVTVRAVTTSARGAWSTTFSGDVRPGRGGQPVRLERKDGPRWRTAATGRLTRASTYTFTVRHTRAGSYAYRVVRPADTGLGAGTVAHTLRLTGSPKPVRPAPPRGGGSGGPAGRLLVTGDSLAFYLGQQLATARGSRPTSVESRHSSGLARPEYFDWAGFARRQVAAGAPGAVVVFLGGNDCQPLRAGGTGAWTSVGTDRWAAEYRRRAAELMRTYAGSGARPVYWIGLPIARKPAISACYRQLNAATAAAARGVRGVRWVDSWSTYAVNGRYADRVQGVVARQEDGIHLTFAGTRLLTRKLLGLL